MLRVKSIKDVMAVGPTVLIKAEEHKDKTSAGVIMPDSSEDRDAVIMGEVLSLGLAEGMSGHYHSPEMEFAKALFYERVKVGSRVVCKKFDYTLVKVEDDDENEYMIYDIKSIIGVIKE